MALQRNVIAIVDDDAGIREALRRLLPDFGYRTELFESAEEFISAAATTEAACVIVDLELGGISGLELARHLSANGFTFPIIFMTGSDDEMLRERAMDVGGIAYLHKPVSLDRLIDAIDKAVAQVPQGNGLDTT